MKKRTQLEKISVVALAGLCVFLVFKLVSSIKGTPRAVAGSGTTVSTAPASPASPANSAQKNSDASPDSNSSMHVQTLEKYEPEPLPDLLRDPFDFGAPPLTPAQKAALAGRGINGAMTGGSASAQPRIPLRAIGYSERNGVGPEAYLVDSDDVFIVHDGDVVSKRFKVLKITSMTVEVQDGASGEKAQLPIPEVQ